MTAMPTVVEALAHERELDAILQQVGPKDDPYLRAKQAEPVILERVR